MPIRIRLPLIVLSGLLCLSVLPACAPVIVGGAATGVAVVHDRRTAGTVLEDQNIEWKASSALREDAEIREQAHINVTSFNNVVLLSGETPSEAMRQRAGDIVRSVAKVKRVHNELTVAAPSAIMSRSSDTLITAKVKTRMISIKDMEGFDFTRVKIVTENGTVFMMGLLSRQEADAATEAARQVSGVQRVVKLFEYLN